MGWFVLNVALPALVLKALLSQDVGDTLSGRFLPVSYTHLRAHETVLDLVCRLLLEKKKHTI